MAFKLPQFKFFSTASTTSRIFILVAAVAVIGFGIYSLIRYLSPSGPTGASHVADAPSQLQSVPGGQLTSEYYKAVMQANEQAAQQALRSGTSAVPTLVNPGGQVSATPPTTGSDCTIICPGAEEADVANDINDLVRQGKLSQQDANKLLALAKADVPVSEYAAALDELVRQGKLTPEQARKLLETYKRQHENAMVNEGAKTMDALIRSGKLPLDAANALLALQKKNVSPAEYAAELDRLVREGKISPETAAQLLAQYTQQHAKEAAKEGIAQLDQMVRAGEITPDVAKDLADLQSKGVPVDQYAAELQRLVAAGKLTPAQAAKLLEQYKKMKAGLGPADTLKNMVAKAQTANADMINDLVKNGKLSPEAANALLDMERRNVTPEEYAKYLDQLVREGKLSPEDAKRLLANYKKLYGLKNAAQRLIDLQNKNVPTGEYLDELKRAVAAGVISPEEAARLLQQYQALNSPALPPGTAATVDTSIPGASDFAKLQQRVQQQQPGGTGLPGTETAQFAEAANQAQAEAAQQRAQRIQDIESRMSSQAQQLITTAWAPFVMQHVQGAGEKEKPAGPAGTEPTSGPPGTGGTSPSGQPTGPIRFPLVKAGDILFAVLDTTVDSDYPDTPVLATIISPGKLKGAKLLGKLSLVQGKEKVSLSFSLMNKAEWPTGKSVSAFAIDPDTARTVMASEVDHHYLLRYGAIMATSFLSGYSNAIMTSGSTNTTGIFGTSTTHSTFSPAEKLAVGIGQIGTSLSNVVAPYANTPATVKVNSGVGLGILFMTDVPE